MTRVSSTRLVNICQQFLCLCHEYFAVFIELNSHLNTGNTNIPAWALCKLILGHTLTLASSGHLHNISQFLFTTFCPSTFVLHPGIMFMNLTFLVKYFLTTLWQFFVISFNGFYPAHNTTIVFKQFY